MGLCGSVVWFVPARAPSLQWEEFHRPGCQSLSVHCAGVRGSAGRVAFQGWGGIIKQVCTAVKAWGNLTCVFLLKFENNWESQRGNI